MALFVQGFNELQNELIKGYGSSIELDACLLKTRDGSLIADINRSAYEKIRNLNLRGILDKIYQGVEEAIIESEKIDSAEDVANFINRSYRTLEDSHTSQIFTSLPHANEFGVAKALKKIYEGKQKLEPSDLAEIGENDKFKPINENFYFPRSVEDIFLETSQVFPSEDLLTIRRPDYVGNSKWDFISARRGDKIISANINDEEWIAEWKSHKIQVLPGDAIFAKIETTKKTHKGRGIIKYEDNIIKIIEIIPQRHVAQFKISLTNEK